MLLVTQATLVKQLALPVERRSLSKVSVGLTAVCELDPPLDSGPYDDDGAANAMFSVASADGGTECKGQSADDRDSTDSHCVTTDVCVGKTLVGGGGSLDDSEGLGGEFQDLRDELWRLVGRALVTLFLEASDETEGWQLANLTANALGTLAMSPAVSAALAADPETVAAVVVKGIAM
jgi:hypothetical protein